jgi:hypothetical protein
MIVAQLFALYIYLCYNNKHTGNLNIIHIQDDYKKVAFKAKACSIICKIDVPVEKHKKETSLQPLIVG